MFTLFDSPPQNPFPVSGNNNTFNFNFIFLMLSMLSLPTLVEAQRGGGGFGGGGGSHVYYGGGAGGGGHCDSNCLGVIGVFGGIGGFVLLVFVAIILCEKDSEEAQIDNSLIVDCPYDDPKYWLNSSEIIIPVSIGKEYSNMIEQLKLDPNLLSSQWEGTYTEFGGCGRFNPKLIFNWNEKNNLMEFNTIEDEQDECGGYRIIKGMFSFENGRFVAHKEYFRPSQQASPYTIIQAGHIEFLIKNDQISVKASGSWYSSYNHSVRGTFEYSKTIQGLTLADKYESYGTFMNPFAP